MDTAPDITKKRILVVEDEHPYLHALTLKLRHAGYESEGVNNGADGLALLKEKKFDLLFLDLVMPDMNGFTMLEEMQKSAIQVPTIVITNLSQEEDRERVKTYGVLDFIEKTDNTIADIVGRVSKHITI